MFNITSHQKSANQKNNEKKRLTILSVAKDVEQLEFSHVADKNAKISTSTLYNRMALCDNVQHTSHSSAISHLCIYPREMNAYICTSTWTWIFSIILNAQNWKHHREILVGSQKEWNINIGKNMDDSQKLYVKLKSRTVCSLIPFIWNTKKGKTKVTADLWLLLRSDPQGESLLGWGNCFLVVVTQLPKFYQTIHWKWVNFIECK